MGGIWGSLRCLAPSKSDKKSQREASKSVITEARLGTGKLSTVSTKDHPELWSRSALWVSGMKAKVQRPEDQVQTRKQTWVQPCLTSQPFRPPQHIANSVLYTYYYNNWKIFYFYICVCVYMTLCQNMENRRGCQIPCSWSYRQLRAVWCGHTRAASAPNQGTTSPALP